MWRGGLAHALQPAVLLCSCEPHPHQAATHLPASRTADFFIKLLLADIRKKQSHATPYIE